MSGRLGKRVVHLANLPLKMLMPSSFSNITEVAFKTIPSATKIEIKRVLESLYGFEVDEVRTLNMDGKKKKYGGTVFKRPDYKKAYVTLRYPLDISPDLFPIPMIEENKRVQAKQSKSKTGTVEDEQSEGWKQSHWLDEKKALVKLGKGALGYDGRGGPRSPPKVAEYKAPWSNVGVGGRYSVRPPRAHGERSPRRGGYKAPRVAVTKFPWSSMRTLNPR